MPFEISQTFGSSSDKIPKPQNYTSKSDLYKTELCKNYLASGTCHYDKKCQFAHGEHELRLIVKNTKYKTKECIQFKKQGLCRYGDRCLFIHNPQEKHRLRTLSDQAVVNALRDYKKEETKNNKRNTIENSTETDKKGIKEELELNETNRLATQTDSLNNLGIRSKFESLLTRKTRGRSYCANSNFSLYTYKPMEGSKLDDVDLMASDSSSSGCEEMENFDIGMDKDRREIEINKGLNEMKEVREGKKVGMEEDAGLSRFRSISFDFSNLYKTYGYKKDGK